MVFLTESQFERCIDKLMLRFDEHFPGCESRYEDDNQIYFRKNDAEWFRIKFTLHPYVENGFEMTLTGPKPDNMDLEAGVGYFGGDVLCFSHMEEEKYVLRLVRKYFIECRYVSNADM